MSEELKACPFCGCEDVEVFHHPDRGGMIGDSWHVECGAEKCGNGTCHHETKAEAITAWNTRATDAALASLQAELAESEYRCATMSESRRLAVKDLSELQAELDEAHAVLWQVAYKNWKDPEYDKVIARAALGVNQ